MSRLTSINPATGEVVGEVERTPVAAIGPLVAEARQAQIGWAARSLDDRIEVLRQAGPLLRARAEDWIGLITSEMGKPTADARNEVEHVVSYLPTLLDELAQALAPAAQQSARIRSTIHRDPFGVVACITPWNFPLLMPFQGLIPALAAGNAVVFKPSEQTPLLGQALADTLCEVLPNGVLRIIHGDSVQGKALVASGVELVVFTGSQAAGQHILRQASADLTRVLLELGGKDPMIVLEGADLVRAARFAARNSFQNAGQVCISTERIYVVEEIHDAFVAALVEATTPVQVGPLIHARQRDHVQRQIQDALDRGAQLTFQAPSPGGNFIGPTILTGCTHEMEIAQEETFGPVACVFRVPDVDTAVRWANDSPFGLGAVVYGPHDLAHSVARRLNAGMIGVNQGLSSAGSTPWVGARRSGYGFHSGIEGHRQFAQVRVVHERITAP